MSLIENLGGRAGVSRRVNSGVGRLLHDMKLILLTTLTLVILASETLAQVNNLPRFEDYPVSQVFSGKPAPVNISSSHKARMYRTMLKRAAMDGPNFAGHYTLVMWMCGIGCAEYGIIDAITGRVFFPSLLSYASNVGWEPERYGLSIRDGGIRYRRDSKLIILYGAPNHEDAAKYGGIFFYVWEDNKLHLIRSVIGGEIWP